MRMDTVQGVMRGGDGCTRAWLAYPDFPGSLAEDAHGAVDGGGDDTIAGGGLAAALETAEEDKVGAEKLGLLGCFSRPRWEIRDERNEMSRSMLGDHDGGAPATANVVSWVVRGRSVAGLRRSGSLEGGRAVDEGEGKAATSIAASRVAVAVDSASVFSFSGQPRVAVMAVLYRGGVL
ncbi:hypothetical protein E2562_003477 [Oryza meyeriana var. granulata]|uniref:Uncharacterized protein n=1 Tax=Oryza meyeriana var. granulata TaxID=110450 RepID=A0A6G1CMV0_9ORYZ|nr:hypothetical protein E2562_003477 [Oryza meyeriana var. granulata]